MKAFCYRLISQLLIVSMMTLPFSTQASLIGTDEVFATAASKADRDKVRDFVARADVRDHLMTLGLDPDTAKDRVRALTDEEVQQVAGKIDTLPAGADGGVGIVIVALLVVILLLVMKR